MSKTVVFGASGFVGSALLPLIGEYAAPLSHEIDLTAPNSWAPVKRLVSDGDSVIMLAAYTREKGAEAALTHANVCMAVNVLAGLEGKDIAHCVYISSDSVYGRKWESINEYTPVCPDSLYGFMHALREQYFREFFPPEKLTILRPCAIYGDGDTHNAYGINRFIREAREKGEITLFGDGEEYRSSIHVDDLAAIIAKALKERISGTYCAVSGKSYRFSQIATIIGANMDKDVAIKHQPRTMPVTHRHFDNATLCKAFFTPRLAPQGIKQVMYAQ